MKTTSSRITICSEAGQITFVSFFRQGAEYQFTMPTTMSDVELVIKDTFQQVHNRLPSEEEENAVYDYLGLLMRTYKSVLM